MSKNLSPTKQRRLLRYEEDYRQLKKELLQVGHVLQGSVTTRWIECGNASCRCHDGPQSRHGPYYQWSWKHQGKTVSRYLNAEQADLCKQWIANHRELEKLSNACATCQYVLPGFTIFDISDLKKLYGVSPRSRIGLNRCA